MNAVAPLIPCIVSGGSGTRLWPVSRESMPKPFMRLADDQSLLQKTFLRIAGLPDVARLLTVTNRDLLFRTLDDYRAVNRSGLAQDLLLEPVGRNTAPAIAAAALHVQEHFGDQAQLLILPADHLIRDEQAFAAAVAEARGLAAQGYLVTFGITPERAETGFGYIEQGAPLGNGFRVARFVEKPDQALRRIDVAVADVVQHAFAAYLVAVLVRRAEFAQRLPGADVAPADGAGHHGDLVR
ncbi:sugar phosphate nucleotidyltransferase, partial [Pseudomonas aeruginosa]|uniref:sugar phosphate nucleotidyltransferase n=1 Tax=Pseudomonas aeruginosa TaxID=287 RepID=UPI001FB71A0B